MSKIFFLYFIRTVSADLVEVELSPMISNLLVYIIYLLIYLCHIYF